MNHIYTRFGILLLVILMFGALCLTSCGGDTEKPAETQAVTEAKELTVAAWLENKGGNAEQTLTVTIKEIVNPVWAVVEDSTGFTHLFGVNVGGEFKPFEEAGLNVGDTIVISAGEYNEYDGTVEIKNADLIEKK